MKTIIANSFLLLILISLACRPSRMQVQTDKVKVDAPFDMPEIEIPNFSNCKKYVITDFGAEPKDAELNTSAIEKAIEAAHSGGGGIVVIPAGKWHTKKIHLKSHVNLHLEKDAILLFSTYPKDYLPAVHTTWEGMECYNYSPLIYAYNCENIALTGQGTLIAQLDTWKDWYRRPPAHMNSLKWLYEKASTYAPVEERNMVNDSSNLRPQFVQFNRCNKILVEGISIQNSPFWTLHPYLSKNIVIRNVSIKAHGHNNDGVDPEMSQNVLIENCVFDQGDDAIAVKAGRNQDAWRLATPTKNIVIRNCVVRNGHQLLAIGSELSGGVENLYMEGCEVIDGAKLNHLVYIKTNERRGGYVKNIFIENIKSGKIDRGILGIETDVLYQWRNLVPTYEARLTDIRNISLKNIEATDVQFISRIQGQEDKPVQNISLSNISTQKVRETNFLNTHVEGFNRF